MQESDGKQEGGGDGFGQAAAQMIQAAGQRGRQAVRQAVSNAAAASVKAGMKSGKAVSGIAAGTAAGGPWGAVLSAAWSLRHILFRVLACICLVLLVLTVVLASFPSIILKSVFGMDGTKPGEDVTMESAYAEMAEAVMKVIDEGYSDAVSRADRMIEDGGYDYGASKEALNNLAQESAGYDVCYILAAYSVSRGIQDVRKDDMLSKLRGVKAQMFPVTGEVKEVQVYSESQEKITFQEGRVQIWTGRRWKNEERQTAEGGKLRNEEKRREPGTDIRKKKERGCGKQGGIQGLCRTDPGSVFIPDGSG